MHIYNDSKFFFKRKLYSYEKNKKKSKFEDLIVNGNDIIQSSVVLKKKIDK